MSQTNVEADPLFQLLTDALRAGPGSPEWHQAVARLRDGGVQASVHADEFRLLVAAREHLESGRDWRSVRAGPGFTRKLLDRLDDEPPPGKRPGLPTATLIALLSGLAVVAVIALVVWQIYPRGGASPVPGTVADLDHAIFLNEVASATFDDGASSAIQRGWRAIGPLELQETKSGLRPVASTSVGIGGALVAPRTVGADEPFAVEATLGLGRPSDDVIVQVFVSGDGDFNPDKATSAHELVWSLRGARQQVILGQASSPAQSPRPEPGTGDAAHAIVVRLLVNRDAAIVESDGQRLWSGPHGLPPNPRFVGVRFLRAGPAKSAEPATIQSIRIRR